MLVFRTQELMPKEKNVDMKSYSLNYYLKKCIECIKESLHVDICQTCKVNLISRVELYR